MAYVSLLLNSPVEIKTDTDTIFVDAALVFKVLIFFRVFLSVCLCLVPVLLFFPATVYGLMRAVGMSWLGSTRAPSAG